MFVLSLVALNYFIRFRYLNKYTELNEVPLVKADAQELHPDVNTPEAAPAFHNYLDEFLQAVRIFGFLEKPVSYSHARKPCLTNEYRSFMNLRDISKRGGSLQVTACPSTRTRASTV